MKFEKLIMNNFMRYKGENVIEFSLDPEKNVTVVLGDNTVGKTTIAQAFRFCLYGAVMVERDKKEGDYHLLNNDVLALMDANSRAFVQVEIIAADDEKRYDLKRTVEYVRAYPKLIERETNKKTELEIVDVKDSKVRVSVDEDKIDDVINEIFPKFLSHYFLFDGEKWNDTTVNGIRRSIKESVHSLTGLSASQKALYHLKDMGANSVIRNMKEKITGEGNLFDNYVRERQQLEQTMEKCEEDNKSINRNLEIEEKKIYDLEQFIEKNLQNENLQMQLKQQIATTEAQRNRSNTDYKMLVNEVSEKAFMMFAQPMINKCMTMVKQVAGERRDIPHMRQASIDHIIKNGVCICGTKIEQNSKEWNCLMEQRNYLPPADIGSLLGEFERTGNAWRNKCEGVVSELIDQADAAQKALDDYYESVNAVNRLEGQLDQIVDVAAARKELKDTRNRIQQLTMKKGENAGRVNDCRRKIESIERNMKLQESKNEENAKWNRRIEIAEQIYVRMKSGFEEQEKRVFLELNESIQKNFLKMFNAKDKKIELTEQYEIQMLYKSENGYREEKNLSEGEKIARNFAFIVSVMEYSRKRKIHAAEDEIAGDVLPIVLDGPFSKLGDENIHLTASVLPQVSEQVILFMLKKDWKFTGLDDFVGASYVIDKEADHAYASIQKREVL